MDVDNDRLTTMVWQVPPLKVEGAEAQNPHLYL